jgi:hypothetical protein
MLVKDDAEHQIPEPWRAMFRQIVNAFVAGDFQLREHEIDGILAVDAETAKLISDNIAAYGEALAPLDEAVWDWSAYRWMGGYWQMLVDLTTIEEPVSDLALHAKAHVADGPRLEISSVHVP